ncbi:MULTISPECIES: hypothetical protein [unclassified Variovorax]|uniref:hypothetical protein n=1 Tax=unclassified Variovorax TaxID=663243 RepID=UPI0011604B1A|nr:MULTISPECIES: hypothetical protein [unclassified Variovorax]
MAPIFLEPGMSFDVAPLGRHRLGQMNARALFPGWRAIEHADEMKSDSGWHRGVSLSGFFSP